ncbi:MAG: galactokinase [Geodermatophilaceae bacterium]|nr:galactokinase [Geodermatophilaceae bacterium]MDQ3455735.1 galactokinase [Actinomycetota bacterium]
MAVRASTVGDVFAGAYGRPPAGLWAAPGRVNLIGEHTDYNDGFALPFALAHRVVCAAAPRADGQARVRSQQAPEEEVTVGIADLGPGTVSGWAAYPLGVLWALQAAGHPVGGVDLLLDGDVPLGAGLSSSAAVECAVALAVSELSGLDLDRTALAGIARRAENDIVGAPTGVLDQMISLHGRAGHLMLLDTRSMQVESVPFDLDRRGLVLLVFDTRAPHRLVDGAYAERRRACERAAAHLGLPALRDLDVAALDGPAFASLPAELRRRTRHVVTENARVLAVVAALRADADPRVVGPLLTASHLSLRDDFEVTVPELDVAVEAALGAGAHGARMTGGGFGGCVIALVDSARAPDVSDAVAAAFRDSGFSAPRSFVTRPAVGAHRIA